MPTENPHPRPIATQVARINQGGVVLATAISRQWGAGDAARCRLCGPSPCAINRTGNNCLIMVSEHVSNADAAMYRLPGHPSSVLKTIGWPDAS